MPCGGLGGLGVAVREFTLEKPHGRVDYLLFVKGQPAGVIEAKPEGTTLTEVERQSGKYVEGLPDWIKPPVYPLPFIYESTGSETRFTNGYDPEAGSRRVFTFHRPETLIEWLRQIAEKQWLTWIKENIIGERRPGAGPHRAAGRRGPGASPGRCRPVPGLGPGPARELTPGPLPRPGRGHPATARPARRGGRRGRPGHRAGRGRPGHRTAPVRRAPGTHRPGRRLPRPAGSGRRGRNVAAGAGAAAGHADRAAGPAAGPAAAIPGPAPFIAAPAARAPQAEIKAYDREALPSQITG